MELRKCNSEELKDISGYTSRNNKQLSKSLMFGLNFSNAFLLLNVGYIYIIASQSKDLRIHTETTKR